ncbi:unnamed protein product [Rotaria sordida]|uniref:Uncharacterized protein n=1 Tax=Rotaria sordida TaxID=392033 RepID=A0A815I9M2_9BILA|nr:unnamed protein product [Rotaria sordida]CAF1406767.1 unnamed protein product [Rotaria sordida]CAF1626258.1 unnamed protein product [Rotaria sordida]CAF3968786.1 unnamed protein product [Rotaria sordida]
MASKELNGDQWEKIILDNIPKLKVFRFQMFVSLNWIDNTEQQIDQLLNTFRTPFWLNEHQCPSIRRLRINPYSRHLHFDFDHLQCTEFLTTPLVLQCEVLEIRIRSPESILDILNSIKNRRSMTIHVADAIHLQPRITEK